MFEVHREEDGELVGFVAPDGGGWRALTVFGAELERCAERADAEALLVRDGLPVLADRWWRGAEPVLIREAAPGRATVLVGNPYDPRAVPLTGREAAALRRTPPGASGRSRG